MTPDPAAPPDGGGGSPAPPRAAYSIVLGVAGFALLFVLAPAAFALGVAAVTTGVHALREIRRAPGARGMTLATYGLLVGGVAAAFGLVAMVLDLWIGTA